MAENAGNIIHGNAPFEMFPDAHSRWEETWRTSGATSWLDFVNNHASHLILTLANTFRVDEEDGAKYARLIASLEKVTTPIVVFGCGIQAPSSDIERHTVSPEAVELMQLLGERSVAVGVRGETTARAFSHFAGVENTFVTGCPSLFSRPTALKDLGNDLDLSRGTPSYNGTAYHLEPERSMIKAAIKADTFLVEPVNSRNHMYWRGVLGGEQEPEVPYFLKAMTRGDANVDLAGYFQRRYRLFRQTEPWFDFNAEVVSYTYGTRFHTNMASLLSGRPALWVTHDARTEELVKYLHLPSVSIAEAAETDPRDFGSLIDYSDFFAHIDGLFDRFNEYLTLNGLREIPTPLW